MRPTLTLLLFFLLQNSASGQAITGFAQSTTAQQREIEQQFLSLPRAANLEKYLFRLTEDPHLAGSAAGKRVAEYINEKYTEWGLASELVEYHAYLPYPARVEVTLLQPDSIQLDLQEPFWRFDKDSYDHRAVTAFNAYSPSGDVTAQVVYVNRGLPDDYDALAELGVDVRGKLALARYGGSFRGVKAKVAEENGAAGLIIYSDPKDDGYMKGDVYPHGPMRHEAAIQRGSLLYIFHYPGDPLTPGAPATAKAQRIKPEEAENMARIPTTPISYGQARLIFENLAGPEVPNGWQGGLPLRYHVGPGPALVRLNLDMDYEVRPIYNVIATIPGVAEPDKMVIIGNHHDAWVHGAVDPNSGTAVGMEVGRSLGHLLAMGWRPKRTIVLARWDAEEYGLIGSTEWVEEHKAKLTEHAVLYINIDVAVAGENFGAGATPSLDGFIQEVIREIEDPKTGRSVFERWWARQNEKEYVRLGKVLPDTAEIQVGRLGSGSDYTAFLQHAGVPSISMGFSGRYGVYHSTLDNFYWMKNWGDPTFVYHEAMTKIGGLMALRAAQADIHPFDYAHYAATVLKHIADLEKRLHGKFLHVEIDLSRLREKVSAWQSACKSLNERSVAALGNSAEHARLNTLLSNLERHLTQSPGLPGRDWFKHRIYAPGFYTGYAAKPLAGIAEPAEQANWDTARREMETLIALLETSIQAIHAAVAEHASGK